MTINLGTGVLTWKRGERVSDRYGTVYLREDDRAPASGDDAPKVLESVLDNDACASAIGLPGSLVATVLDPRDSTHIGDLFRGLFPTRPDKSERIVLGTGVLFTETQYDDVVVGLQPARDHRPFDWLDPVALYRAHDQLVTLTFEPEQAA